MVRELSEGETTIDSFDPLMHAHNAIMANTLSLVGPAVLVVGDGPDEGHHCPLCFLNESHAATCEGPPCILGPTAFDEWIDKAADEARDKWQAMRP